MTVNPVRPAAPSPGPAAASTKANMHLQAVQETYGSAIAALPGVTGVTEGTPDCLVIHTATDGESAFLQGMLRENLTGVPLRYAWATHAAERPTPPAPDASAVRAKYADALARLPGVAKIQVLSRARGPLQPGFEDQLVVKVTRPVFTRYRNLVKERLDGVKVSWEPTSCFGTV